MSKPSWIRLTLPTLLFPIISVVGITTIVTRSLNPSFLKRINSKCDHGEPLNMRYIGLQAIDEGLPCHIVSFFDQGLQPVSTPYMAYFLFNFAPVVVFMLVEECRPGRSRWISAGAATIFGLLYQLASGAAIVPLYFLTFLLHAQNSFTLPPVSEAHAEATSFAFLVGYFLPTSFMIYTKDPHVIALWQPFPLWMYLAQKLHLLIRPPRPANKGVVAPSGRKTLQALYGLTMVTSALAHLSVIWPIMNDLPALRESLFPRFIYPNEEVDLADGARNLLQWDAMFTFAGATIAALWFGRNARETVTVALWCVSTSVTMGPGAALAMVYAWRENRVA